MSTWAIKPSCLPVRPVLFPIFLTFRRSRGTQSHPPRRYRPASRRDQGWAARACCGRRKPAFTIPGLSVTNAMASTRMGILRPTSKTTSCPSWTRALTALTTIPTRMALNLPMASSTNSTSGKRNHRTSTHCGGSKCGSARSRSNRAKSARSAWWATSRTDAPSRHGALLSPWALVSTHVELGN